MKRIETTDDWDSLGGKIFFIERGGFYGVSYDIGNHFKVKFFSKRCKAIRFYLKMIKSTLKVESVAKRLNMFKR